MEMVLRGYDGKRLHSSFADGPLEITGSFWCEGPQPIGKEGGIPDDVATFYDTHPDVKVMSLEWERDGRTNSVVYSRMKETLL